MLLKWNYHIFNSYIKWDLNLHLKGLVITFCISYLLSALLMEMQYQKPFKNKLEIPRVYISSLTTQNRNSVKNKFRFTNVLRNQKKSNIKNNNCEHKSPGLQGMKTYSSVSWRTISDWPSPVKLTLGLVASSFRLEVLPVIPTCIPPDALWKSQHISICLHFIAELMSIHV